jgi:hypothetical protein
VEKIVDKTIVENGQSSVTKLNDNDNNFIIEKLNKLEHSLQMLQVTKVETEIKPSIKDKAIKEEDKVNVPIPKLQKVVKPNIGIEDEFKDIIPIVEKVNRLKDQIECCEKK